MKLSLGKTEGNKLDFVIEDCDAGFANMIRRYGMMSVPVFAIDNIVFYENTTSIFDEYLAHRLGQIPLTTPAKSTKNEEVTFVIDEIGPKTISSGDMKSTDKDVKPARDKIPVFTLTEGQKLRMEAKARVGRGWEHAKFQAGLLSYGADGNKFSFKVESFYQMPPKEVVLRACDEILDDISELRKGLKKK